MLSSKGYSNSFVEVKPLPNIQHTTQYAKHSTQNTIHKTHNCQSDRMARLLFHYLPIYNNEDLRKYVIFLPETQYPKNHQLFFTFCKSGENSSNLVTVKLQIKVFKCAISGLFFFIFVFSTVNSKYAHYKILPMAGFEPKSTGIRSNRSAANWATARNSPSWSTSHDMWTPQKYLR